MRSILKSNDVKALKNAAPYDIALSNAQKWRRASKKQPVPNYEDLPADLFSIIIVDEAHHLPAKQWQEILDKFSAYARVVFFTATPYRCDGKEITKDRALTKVGFAYKLSREEAIASKLIRDVEWEVIPYHDTPPSRKKSRSSATESKVGNNKKINEDRMDYAAEVIFKVKERLKKKNKESPLPGNKKHASIIAAYSINEAEEISKMCLNLDFDPKSVVVVHSVNKKWANEQIIDNIKEGHYEVVIVVKMLLEGFDYPPFSIAGIATKIMSPVKFAQFIGRVQRVVREKGADSEQKADVITHEYFDQEDLIEGYCHPVIADEDEDKCLDFEESTDLLLDYPTY